MATITSLGVGSGLDLESLVTKLMAAESAPLTALQKKQSSINTKISALGTLKSKLADLQSAAKSLQKETGRTALDKFATFSTTSSDSSVASATAGIGAVAGTYTLNVTKLAQAQRFVSGSFAATDTAIGPIGDTLTFDFATPDADGNSRSKTITLDSTNNSLAGLRNAINGANMGVTATIINGADGSHTLVVNGQEGLDNEITLSGNLDSQLTQTVSAQNAEFTLNGVATSSSTNSTSKAIDGLTLNFSKLGSTTLSVTADYATQMTTSLNAFIKAYNDLNSTMTTMGAYNPATKVAGSLQGNNVLRDTQSQTRALIFNTTVGGSSSLQRLSDIGVSVGTDGALSLDSAKLSKALASDSNAVAALLDKVGTAFSTTVEVRVYSRICGSTSEPVDT